jgi:putative protease
VDIVENHGIRTAILDVSFTCHMPDCLEMPYWPAVRGAETIEDPEGYVYDDRLLAELETVSHREYCTGYYFDEPSYENNTVTNMGYIREKAYLARVISYDKETKRAYLFQRNKMVNGQTAELVTPGKFGIPFTVRNMTDKYGNPIDSAPHPLMEFYIESDIEMHEGDLIRGAE